MAVKMASFKPTLFLACPMHTLIHIAFTGIHSNNTRMMMQFMQAARVMYAGRHIGHLGMELRTRPYLYAETPMLDLDSFEQYCVNAKVQVGE